MAAARSSAWMWLVYTSSASINAGALAQAFQRQPVGAIDAGHAQDRYAGAGVAGPASQRPLGVDAAQRAGVARRHSPGFVEQRAAAVAVDPAGADINEPRPLG